VQIGDTADDFAAGIATALDMNGSRPGWLMKVDDHLKEISWDRTWRGMHDLMDEVLGVQRRVTEMPAVRTS
jgi:hypothetical protein